MAATTRWVQYDISEVGVAGTGGSTPAGTGTAGFSRATASVSDTFDIGAASNRLYVSIDSVSGPYITLASGTDLDPRFIAKDISEKLHNLGKATEGFDRARCVWENDDTRTGFVIYSGGLGSSSSVVVSSGTNTAHIELGWGTKTETGGSAHSNTFDGAVTVSGTYEGFFDEMYHIVINKELNIGTPSKGGSNTYTGTMTAGGVFNHTSDITYTISIDVTNGTTMGGGTGNVPTMEWTSGAGGDDSSAAIELLYPNYWYKVGTKGLMVKFTDAVFNTVTTGWTVACTYPQYTHGTNTTGAVGSALFTWGSSRGDDADQAYATHATTPVRLGTRGLYVTFTGGTTNLGAGDEFFVMCSAPQPQSYDITNLNYGNVTVSTESAVKAVMFEIMSGAIEISTVKFGLQNNGSFSHHNAGNSDTYFRFGTVGPGNNAGTSPINGKEWRQNVLAADISSDTPPSYLYATEDNLSVVSDADNSESIGASAAAGMVSDPIWLNVKLGASEVGANSTINYRIFFDYS
jgi:hypothetical protein